MDEINDSEINLINYSIVRCDSTSTHTGGVVIYIKKGLKFRILNQIHLPMRVWCLCIEVYSSVINEVIAVVYRSPNSSECEFCIHLSEWFDQMLLANPNIVIVGDFNIDLLKDNTYKRRMSEIMINSNCKQLLNKPTRITETTRTLVDYVLTPIEREISADTVPDIKISDHESIVVKIPVQKKNEPKSDIKSIDLFKYDKNLFKSLMQRKCENMINISDCSRLSKKLQKSLAECVSELTVRKRIFPRDNKWFTIELQELKNKKVRYHQRACILNLPEDWYEYRRLRNWYKSKLQSAKRNYMCNKIENCSNQKDMWRVIKVLVFKKERVEINEVQFADRKESDKQIIANKFNSYFIESVNNISNSITPSSNNINIEEKQTTFRFRPICINELRVKCKKMNNKNDVLKLNIKMYLDCFDIVGPIIVQIINDSFNRGVFPQNLKESIIIPIPKETNNIDCDKFRPINMLPLLEKIIENVAYDQLSKYVLDNKLLIENQSGFRPEHSCETALTWLIMTLKQKRHDKNKIVAIFLDFQRAFETINRERLLNKLFKYGIRNQELGWFRSYLNERTQRTKINNAVSVSGYTNFGVPQGTILGPLLFLLYINDLCNVIQHCSISLFADDALMFMCGNDETLIMERINSDLNDLCSWLAKNKLKINVKKNKVYGYK